VPDFPIPKFSQALMKELKNDICIVSTVASPSGPLFNALFEIGLNPNNYFHYFPNQVTMWLVDGKVIIYDESQACFGGRTLFNIKDGKNGE
jgi:hypothetical protein